MKFTAPILLLIIISFNNGYGQIKKKRSQDSPYYRLIQTSANSGKYRAELSSDLDPAWEKWDIRGYNFGFDPNSTPVYTTVNGILSTPYMIQVRGNDLERNRKRWGYHVFEGYARDDKSRITLLVNKHTEIEKPVAELYYYGTEYNHSEKAYNWFRIGSDVRQHSYLFSRDKAIFYGTLELTNTLTLGRLGKENMQSTPPTGDDETNYSESAKHVNYLALKNAEDGAMFYDADNKMVVIRINGQWMKLMVEPLPPNVQYDLE